MGENLDTKPRLIGVTNDKKLVCFFSYIQPLIPVKNNIKRI